MGAHRGPASGGTVYDRGVDKPDGRRGSDVIDAILDKVTEDNENRNPASVLFRAKALEQLDVAAEVDTRLPLVSRRSWLALVGVGLLVAAFALWASLTPSITSVSAQGRVVGGSGAVTVATQSDGVLVSAAEPGTAVTAGENVATIESSPRTVELATTVAGTVWQELSVPGASVRAGDPVLTLLPPGSADQVLLAIAEHEAAAIVPGMKVQVTSLGSTEGAVDTISGPVTAAQAGERTGLIFPDTTTYVLVSVRLARPMPPGAVAAGMVVLSEGTVLTRLLGRT